MTPSHHGKRVVIVIPDCTRIEMSVPPALLASELLELAASHVGLKEKEYFGLASLDEE